MRKYALMVILSLACSSTSQQSRSSTQYDSEVARYRLLLRRNTVDPGQAFRCYGGCQSQKTPGGYLGCLAQCPAFEVTEGVACAPSEVPPIAACITARRVPQEKDELSSAFIVLAVIANIALIVGATSVCSSSPNCSTGNFYYYPGQLPVSGPGKF